MGLRRLDLRDFRNFATAELDLAPRFCVLWGHNGAGKTNLLEAIYLVSTLRSFRTSDLGTLVRHGCEGASVTLRAEDPVAGLDTTLEVRLARRGNTTRRTAVADGKTVRAAADFYGRVRAILFTPEDLGVLRGSPSGRRQFLDRVLFARDRGHIGDVQRYDKLLRSRNHVLRSPEVDPGARVDLLATYEAGLAETGARIWSRRAALLEELREPFAAAFARIHGQPGSEPAPKDGAPGLRAAVSYEARLGEVPEAERPAALREALAGRRGEDERRGATSIGPHRDDLRIELEGRPAADFASQGQARALVLAFKLAELQAARAATDVAPLLLLDDVSSELDPERMALLFAALADEAGQCVLTTTAPHFIRLPSTADVRQWRVDCGRLVADVD